MVDLKNTQSSKDKKTFETDTKVVKWGGELGKVSITVHKKSLENHKEELIGKTSSMFERLEWENVFNGDLREFRCQPHLIPHLILENFDKFFLKTRRNGVKTERFYIKLSMTILQ